MSTFSGLNTAYTGLVASQKGLDVVGQNIANANTVGYTRQRVTTSPVSAVVTVNGASQVGQGVSVNGIARLGSNQLDAQVRSTSAASGYWSARSVALSTLETGLQEPGANGLSTQLQDFWASWQDLSNNAGDSAPGAALLQKASALATRIGDGYRALDTQWSQTRSNLGGMVSQLNSAASQVADLNVQIRTTLAAGGSANELIDQRDTLTNTIAGLVGGTVRDLGNGMVDVVVGGNAIVSGGTSRAVQAAGAQSLADTTTGQSVSLEFSSSPGTPIALDGGSIAGTISVLTPANASATGGAIAEAAASYNAFATDLATKVNAIHETGVTTDGVTTGLDFFGFTAGVPAAEGLTVIPTSSAGIATGTVGGGPYDGSNADAISQLGSASTSPDKLWSGFVSGIGAATQSVLQQSSLADFASTSAQGAQQSNSGVSLDEENVNLLTYQHAYQGAARVMTAMDQMLDVLINHTGIVGI
jgi:flagellar hook-associated protein 1 FlgK